MCPGCKLTVAAAWITYVALQEPCVTVYQNSNISTTVWGAGYEIKRKWGNLKKKYWANISCWWTASEVIAHMPAFAKISSGKAVGKERERDWWTWVQHGDPQLLQLELALGLASCHIMERWLVQGHSKYGYLTKCSAYLNEMRGICISLAIYTEADASCNVSYIFIDAPRKICSVMYCLINKRMRFWYHMKQKKGERRWGMSFDGHW